MASSEWEPAVADGGAALLFVRKFLRHGTRVASVAPSSRALAAAMCRHVNSDRPQTILELGAGTGAVTAAIVERMHPESRLIAVELDPDFAALAATRCPRAEVLCADARHVAVELAALEVRELDLVLSGLPLPSLPRDVTRPIFAMLEAFAANAIYSQLTVMPWVYQHLYKRLFERVEFDLVVRNLPPGGVYHCRTLRGGYADHLPGATDRSERRR